MNQTTMNAKDAISGKSGRAFVTIEDQRYEMLQVKNIEATAEKNKIEVPIMGRISSGNKANGLTLSGSMTLYYNTKIFRELLIRYKETGEDIYFDLQVENDDPTSAAGRQTVMLLGCNFDSITLAMLDVDSELLEEDIDFTFEDFSFPEQFALLPGMQ